MPLVEIKYFDALIGNKPFFDQPVKTSKKSMKKLSKCQEMLTTTRNLLDYLNHEKYYELTGIDLSRQKKYECFPIVFFFCMKNRRKSWCNIVFYC